MQQKYHISHDGVIYSIGGDSSITKYGRIGSDGRITAIEGCPLTATGAAAPEVTVRRRPVWGYWLVIILLLLAGGVGAYAFMRQYEEKEELSQQINRAKRQADNDAGTLVQKDQLIERLRNEIDGVNRSRFLAEKTLEEVCTQAKSITPLLVTGMEFRNINSAGKPLGNYGMPLKCESLRFVQARVSYYGMVTGLRTFKVRLIGPKGPVGSSEFAFSSNRPVENGAGHSFELSGFGFNDGRWMPGKYYYELWYGDNMIARSEFELS